MCRRIRCSLSDAEFERTSSELSLGLVPRQCHLYTPHTPFHLEALLNKLGKRKRLVGGAGVLLGVKRGRCKEKGEGQQNLVCIQREHAIGLLCISFYPCPIYKHRGGVSLERSIA